CMPIHIVSNNALRHFLNELDPAFLIPCEETVKNIIYSAYNYSFLQLKPQIIAEAISVSLTMDLWTARNHQGYLGITCSYVDQFFRLKEFMLDIVYIKYPHIAKNISNTVEEILKD
ncbi:20347_t:CDS:1, partial [Racocetra persica]